MTVDNAHDFKTLLPLTAEARLLLLCAGEISTPTSVEELESLLEQPLEWELVLENSQWHRLSARLYYHLRDHRYSSRVPRPVMEQLQEASRALDSTEA